MDAGDDPTIRTAIHDQRRRFLRALGVAGAVGVAGCLGDDGDDGGNGNENGDENGGDDENGDGPTSAYFGVSGLDPDTIEVDQGDAFDVGATVENTGDIEGAQIVELQVDGEERATQSVSLDAGDETDVSFESVETEDVEPGEYEFGVYTDDDSATGSLVVDDAGPFSVDDTEGVHTDVLHEEDGQVARYMYEYDPSDEPSEYEYMEMDDPTRYDDTFKPLLHVWDPEVDAPLTSDPSQEGQYAHHRGIFIGWNNIEAYGQSIDNWHTEPTVHQEFDPSLEEFDGEQALTSITHWLTEPDGDVYLVETREMEFHEPQTEDGVVVVDCSFTLEFETDVDLFGDPEHGGIQYRANDEVWENGSAEYYFSDHWDWGENPGQGSVDQEYGYDWVGMEATMHDQEYFVVHMNHPDNPEETTYSAYRDYGRFGAYWEDSFEEGDEITVTYRIVVERGSAPDGEKETIDEWFADFVDEA